MPQWELKIQITYTNNGGVDFSGNAVCNVYYPFYSTEKPVGTSVIPVTIKAGETLTVTHTIKTDPLVDIPGKAVVEVEVYLKDNGKVYSYKRAKITLPDKSMIKPEDIKLIEAKALTT